MSTWRRSLLRALTLLFAAALVVSLANTPWPLLLPVLIVALGEALLIVHLDRDEPEPLSLLVSGLLYGAVAAAFASMMLNEAMGTWLTAELGHDSAGALMPVYGAPVIEELAKGAVLATLLFLRSSTQDPVLDGIVCGALVGIGFAMTENINYLLLSAVFGGDRHLPEMIYQRALGSLNHPIFSATFGAGIGWARRRAAHRLPPALLGACAAVVQHVAWNGLTSPFTKAALCGATGTDTCGPPSAWALFAVVPLVITISLAPGAVALTMLFRRALRRAALLAHSAERNVPP